MPTRRSRTRTFPLLLAAALAASLATGLAPAAAAVDVTGPSLEVHPGLRFVDGAQLSSAGASPSVLARVTWTRTDRSGVCAQRVQVRDLDRSGSARTIHPGKGARHVSLQVVVDHRYRVEVRATDCAGNETVRARTVSARLLQENSNRLFLESEDGTWDVEQRPRASGGAWALDEGQVVVFEAARSIALVGATGPGRGSATVTSVSTSAEVDADGPARTRVVVFQDRWEELTEADAPVLEVLTRAPFVVDAVLVG